MLVLALVFFEAVFLALDLEVLLAAAFFRGLAANGFASAFSEAVG